ncbi:MAG: hypothetical protein DWQ05_18065 [Calditrichaeota bacterium]|nr:MAG: hypothetical protein DWQ05_18065 [Calditrichota bacterium]
MLFAGLDVSTQSCKIVVIDLQNDDILYVDSVNYDTDLPEFNTRNGVLQNGESGVSESEPLMWLQAVEMLFGRLQKSHVPQSDIKCISVSGQQHGLVALDAQGGLSRTRSKLWNDFSTQRECDILTEKAGGLSAMVGEVGNAQLTGYTAAKILHMQRHEPEMFARTHTFFLVHNYINWYLTGGVRVMEPGDTSGMALWHPGKQKWSQKVVASIDPALMKKLPPVMPADKSIGSISNNLVEKFGFNQQCKIDAGSGDNMYGAVGTGNIKPGIVTISLGTSGTAYTFLEKAYIDPLGEIAAFCDSTGHFLPLLCVTNLANGYNALLKQFNLNHEAFTTMVQETPPGNEGRILIPWYAGERTPNVPMAAPLYFGFGLHDFKAEVLSRAVLEGHIQNLFTGFKRLPVRPTEIRLTGGLSQSPAWCQAIANIFNTETVPVEGEGAALGAALHAAWVWGKENDRDLSLEEICTSFVKLSANQRKKPDPNQRGIYDNQTKLFSQLSAAIRNNEMAAFRLREKLLSR